MMILTVNEGPRFAGEISFETDKVRKLCGLEPSVIDITLRQSPERARVEKFIHDVYADVHAADIAVDYPTLMSIRDAKGKLFAAAGFRFAQHGPLFLEQYTKAPIESVAAAPRACIAEIGNLASSGGGASVFLFAALAAYLNDKGITHAAVTGTDVLHRQFMRLGLNPQKICDAMPDALTGTHAQWGRYYDTKPRVLVGSVASSITRLRDTLGTDYKNGGDTLYSRLHYGVFQ